MKKKCSRPSGQALIPPLTGNAHLETTHFKKETSLSVNGTLIEDEEKWEATLATIVWVFQFYGRTEVKLLFLVDNFNSLISLQPFNYFLINTISKVFKQMKSPSDLI